MSISCPQGEQGSRNHRTISWGGIHRGRVLERSYKTLEGKGM